MPSNTRPNQYEVKRGSDVIFKGYPTYHGSYMKPCYLEFTNVSVPAPLDLKVGDEVNYTRLGETFKLYEIPEPKKQASSNQSGEAYVYDSIKFYDAAKVLEIALFRNLVENGQYHFSSDTEVSITTNVAGVAGMIQECLSSYAGDSTWSVYLYNDATMQSAYETAVAKDYSASGTCMNALDALSELWNGIGWVYRYINNVHTIIIGYPNVVATTAGYADNNRTMRFAMGSGLRNIKCTPAPIGDFCTRLYPFGSDRNMITGYYQNNTDVYQHASCYIKHLMLPLSEWGITDGKRDASKAFIRSTDLETEFGVIPKEIRFDGSGDYPEVYPSIEKVTAKNIRDAKTALEHTDYVPNATIYPDATRMDTIKAITMPTDDGTASSDGDKYTDKLDQTIATPAQVSVAIPAGGSEYIKCMLTDSTFQREGVVRMDLSDIAFDIDAASGVSIDTQSEFKTAILEVRSGLGTKQYDLSQFVYNLPFARTGRVVCPVLPDIGTTVNPASGWFSVYIYVLLKNTAQFEITATGIFHNIHDISGALSIHWAKRIIIPDTFDVKLKQIGFDMKARVVQCGSSPVISMKSGMCAGREFSVVTKSVQYDASDDSWTMTLQRVKDESVGMVYPNTNYPIAVGDEFVILEIEMPEEYIHMASSRLLELANAAFSKLSSTAPTYEPELDSKYIYIQQSAATPLENTFLRVGKWMWLSDANVIGATDINVLISSLTINEGESNIPTFKVSLVEFKRTGVVTQTQKQVVMLASEVSTMQTAQRAAMRDYNSGDVGGGGTATGGNSVLPVYMDNGEAFPIEGLEVDGNIISTAGGVSAKGLCDLSIHTSGGGGGGGTSNYNDLENKPQINSTTLAGNVSLATLGIAPASHNHSGTYEPVINSSHKINADNVDDRTSTNKFVTASEKANFHAHDNKNILDGITSPLAAVATSGDYDDLSNKPTIPAAQVNADWNATSGVTEILNKPTIPAEQIQSNWTQADTSAKDFIKNKPVIPMVYDSALTIKQNGVEKGIFTANDADDVTINLTDTIYDDTAITGRVSAVENTIGEYGDIVTHNTSEYATAAQGTKADNAVPKTTKINGHALSGDITITKSDVGLSNVDDTSDANKPISTATQAALDGKAASVHTHVVSDVTDLQAALDGKANKNGSSSEDFAVHNLTASGGVSADGMCDLTVQGAGGGGVSDFNDLSNRPNYNGNPMTGGTNIPLVNTSYWNGKANVSDIPTALSQLSEDTTHRLATDNEKSTWNAKYSKPSGGIPKSDLASGVRTSLGKADSALQSYTETDPVFSASAASGITSANINNWNSKQDAIANLSTIESNAQAGKDASVALGGHTVAKDVPSDAKFTDTTYGGDRGISLSSGNFGHSNSIQKATTQSLYKVTIDEYGHITAREKEDDYVMIGNLTIYLGGGITISALGNEFSSSAPAAYATTAKNYDTSAGNIKTAIDNINDSLDDKLEGITANGEATTITNHVANIPAADATHSGVVSTSTQTFAGNKTFNGSINGQSGISAKGMCDLAVLGSGGGVEFGEWQTLVSGVQYRKLGTMVVFRGACNVQDFSSYTDYVSIGTLSSGFRPNAIMTMERPINLYMGQVPDKTGSKTIGNAELKITTAGVIGFKLFQWMYDTRNTMWGRLDFNGMIIFTD